MTQKFLAIVGTQVTEVAETGVTSVTGTAPVASSGGATPAISMAAAASGVPGYLAAADWATFNGKFTPGSALSATSGAFTAPVSVAASSTNTTGGAGTAAVVEVTNTNSGAYGYLAELIFSTGSAGGTNRTAAICSAYTNWNAGGLDGDLQFFTRNLGTMAERVRINASGSVTFFGNVGFNSATPIAKPTITGSRGGNAALASLLTALASYGLITDSTTA